MTGARDQGPESSLTDWSTKFCKLFLRVADKHRQIFVGKENCPVKNWTKAIESDHNQVNNQVDNQVVNLRIIFQNTRRTKSFFPYKDRLNRSQQSKVIYKACCWDCDDFYIGKTKRRLHDRKTEHFKALAKTDNTSAVADHVKTTGHNIKWDHFEILASGKTDYHCKIKETLFIQELKPAFNVNVSSEKLMLY